MSSKAASLLTPVAKTVFVIGLLLVCVVGTAPDVPFHLLGLPLCGLAAVLAGFGCLAEKRRPAPGVLPWVVAVVAAYFAVRAGMSPVRHLAEMDIYLVGALVSGFAMVWFVGKVAWLEPWLWLLALGGAALGVWQFYVNDQCTVLSLLDMRRPIAGNRASGFFYNQNPFGTWCAMLLLLSAAVFFVRRGHWLGRGLAGLAMAACAVGLAHSFCRAATLGAGLGIAVMIGFGVVVVMRWNAPRWKKRAAGAGILALIAAASAAAAYWLPMLAEKRVKGGEVENLAGGVAGRYAYWRTGLSQFLDYPWFGAGSRAYSHLSYQYWDRRMNTGDIEPYYAHSEYVQVLADYGFTGFVLVLLAAALAFGRGIRVADRIAKAEMTRESRAKLAWCLGAMGALTAFLADTAFSFSGHFAPMLLLCGVLCGALAAARPPGVSVSESSHPARLPRFWAVFSVLVVASGFLAGPGWKLGLATFTIQRAKSDHKNQLLDDSGYLAVVREESARAPRFPLWMHAGQYAMMLAMRLPEDAPERRNLTREAIGYFDRSIDAFPGSVLARLERAVANQEAGRESAADEDFLEASRLGKTRELYYHVWMHWGEARYARAMAAWRAGDLEETRRWLRESLDAYRTSEKLAPMGRLERWKLGKQGVQETIDFLKRTGEWSE